MTAAKIYKKFETTITRWEKELEKYSLQDFEKKPARHIWSIGQVYEHITTSTLNFHIKQIETCLVNNASRSRSKRFIGYLSLAIKRIPPVKIKIPPEENVEPQQPADKLIIKKRLNELKNRVYQLAIKIDGANSKGKTNHPGLGYLNAKEWFEVIEMHFGYHWKDKQRVDKFLNS